MAALSAAQPVSIKAIKIGRRFRKDMGDLDGLAASMKDVGLIQPVVVTADLELVAGERRVRAAKSLQWEEIPAVRLDVESLILAEHAENEMRKDFTVSERVAIGKAVEKELGKRQGQRTELKDNCPEVPKGQTRDIAAEKAGFESGKTYERAKKVVESGNAELIEKVDNGEVSISAAAKQVSAQAIETNGEPSNHVEEARPTDPCGLPLNKEGEKLFSILDKFREAESLYAQLAKLVNEIAQTEGGHHFRATLACRHANGKDSFRCSLLYDSFQNLKRTKPYASICPDCYFRHPGEVSRDCKACYGLGIVTEGQWERAPADYKAAVMEGVE